ncbi:unnamed protein product [Lupinus luteus]|uniref:Uncharacterized protein n=1 Tax=Lupinus luteus TaxID=3873 RepID=A0AAV1XNX4_LUPLU
MEKREVGDPTSFSFQLGCDLFLADYMISIPSLPYWNIIIGLYYDKLKGCR